LFGASLRWASLGRFASGWSFLVAPPSAARWPAAQGRGFSYHLFAALKLKRRSSTFALRVATRGPVRLLRIAQSLRAGYTPPRFSDNFGAARAFLADFLLDLKANKW
jgi:hypothetical protein